jgi:prepilin peptidase CpaA
MGAITIIYVLHAVAALLLLIAARSDIQSRTINNWIPLSLAGLAVIVWIASGMTVWPDMAIQTGFGMAIFTFYALFFYLKLMGGGDVKLLGALALWFPPLPLIHLLIAMSLAGVFITILFWVLHKRTKSEGRPEIPYGVAICFGGLWVICERYLNHFG